MLVSLDGNVDFPSRQEKCQLSRQKKSCPSCNLLLQQHPTLETWPCCCCCSEQQNSLWRGSTTAPGTGEEAWEGVLDGSVSVLRNDASVWKYCSQISAPHGRDCHGNMPLAVPSRLTSPAWKNLQTHKLFIALWGDRRLSTQLPGKRVLCDN